MQRLDTGIWPSTEPAAMNRLARSLDAITPKFYEYRQVTKYNRTWLPSVTDFIGKAAAD